MSALTQLDHAGGSASTCRSARDEVRAEDREESRVPHRRFEGKRPTNTILVGRLTPEALGKLVALYEHSVFTEGTVCGASTPSTSGASTPRGTR
jgi:glucose-6-phosphate isomerase